VSAAPDVVVTASPAGDHGAAAVLAERFGLALDERSARSGRFCLRVTPERLELHDHEDAIGPLRIDFDTGPTGYRSLRAGRRQALARATGIHKRSAASVLDATAGAGEDGFVLAALGAEVHMMERNAPLAALLEDAHARCRANGSLPQAAGRLTITHGDALEHLRRRNRPVYDVVYLDPMYPESRSARLPGKAMQYCRNLAGPDSDAAALLAAALRVARQRVVVKRPRRAPALAGPEPEGVVESRQTRYDLYPLAGGSSKGTRHG